MTVNVDGKGTVFKEASNREKLPDYDSRYSVIVCLTTHASEGWVFIGWTGTLETIETVIELTTDNVKSITANFLKAIYLDETLIEGF